MEIGTVGKRADRIERLKYRANVLAFRISAGQVTKLDEEKAELSALEWALRELETVRPEVAPFQRTHRHAEGGFYQVLDTKLKVQMGQVWLNAVRYRNAEGMEFVRDVHTFEKRFHSVSGSEPQVSEK